MRNQLFNKCLETTILSRQTSTTYDKNILQSLPPFVTSLKYTELYIVAFIIPFWKVFLHDWTERVKAKKALRKWPFHS